MGEKNKLLIKQIIERVSSGEKKNVIYEELKQTYDKKDWLKLARFMALVPEPELKDQFKIKNRILIGFLVVVTVIKFLSILGLTFKTKLNPIPFLLFAAFINGLFIFEVARYRGYIYRILGMLSVIGILQILPSFTIGSLRGLGMVINIILMGVLIGVTYLSFQLGKKLYPNYGLFGPHKDSSGNFLV